MSASESSMDRALYGFRQMIANKTLGPESDWLDAMVVGRSGAIFFAVVLKEGISAALPGDVGYNNDEKSIELGDSVQIKIREIINIDEHHRARHLVCDCRLHPDFADSIEIRTSTTGKERVYLTTTAKPTEFADDGKTIILKNNTFGYFVDTRNLVPRDCRSHVTFEFTTQPSQRDRYTSVFQPTKIIKFHGDFASRTPNKQRSSHGQSRRQDDEKSLEEDMNKANRVERKCYDLLRKMWVYDSVRTAMLEADPDACEDIAKMFAEPRQRYASLPSTPR